MNSEELWEQLANLVADVESNDPGAMNGPGLYPLLLRMAKRQINNQQSLITDEEFVLELSKLVFLPIVKKMQGYLMSEFGRGGQLDPSDSKTAGEDQTDSERYTASQKRLPFALQEGHSRLMLWFFRESTGPIWAKALYAKRYEAVEVRNSEAAGHLVTSGIRWLKANIHRHNADAFLDQKIREALANDVFEPLDNNVDKERRPYGLKGRGHALNASLNVDEFARGLGKRKVQLRSPSKQAKEADAPETEADESIIAPRDAIPFNIPFPEQIRELLQEAMEKAGCGFTIPQAKIIVRIVFSLPEGTQHVALREDMSADPQDHPTLQDAAEQLTGQGDCQIAEGLGAMQIASEVRGEERDIGCAVGVITLKLSELDKGLSPDKRPDSTKKGRAARYLLDFEIWEKAQLHAGPTLDKLREAVSDSQKEVRLTKYTQTVFEIWSGCSNSSVSEWCKGERRRLLLAQAAAYYFRPWGKAEEMRPRPIPEVLELLDGVIRDYAQQFKYPKPNTLRAQHFQERLFMRLRLQFFHRKPEFVSAGPLDDDGDV